MSAVVDDFCLLFIKKKVRAIAARARKRNIEYLTRQVLFPARPFCLFLRQW